MKISHNWLKQFIDIENYEVETISHILTDIGLEVEGAEKYQSVKGALKGVVVGEVLTCERIPKTEKLNKTIVNVGLEEPLQIVCGAPNVKAGIKVPVATIGTVLYTSEGEEFEIKKGKIRSVHSFGMICAEDELNIGTSHEGILILDNNLTVGTPMKEVVNIEEDFVYEIGLTPNRSDAMSHWGVARDLAAAINHRETKNISLKLPEVAKFKIKENTKPITIQVEDREQVPRYAGITLSNIKIKPSPEWLQNRLKAIGIIPKNNVVDITNYVMHDLGQPLHAFDLAKVKSDTIIVKNVAKNTKFTTLDEVDRELNGEEIMICDAEKPMCIAGVLGGVDSGVSAATTAIFLESAYFNPVRIRKGAKYHTIHSDASFRFERAIDPEATVYALKYAVLLLQEYAGAIITSELHDEYPTEIPANKVSVSYKRINTLLGKEIVPEIVQSILKQLDIRVVSETEGAMELAIPPYRYDVTRDVDVIEDILRIYGYNNIELPSKLNTSIIFTDRKSDYKAKGIVNQILTNKGLSEIMMNSLTKESYLEYNSEYTKENAVEILNPLSTDLSVMRQGLLHGGLETIAYNLNRKNTTISIYEFGKSYHKIEGDYSENNHLGIWLSGNVNQLNWNQTVAVSDFFRLKTLVFSILNKFGLDETKVVESSVETSYFSDGLTLKYNNKPLVKLGTVNKKTLKNFSIKQSVFYAEFDWTYLLKIWKKITIKFQSIPKYPAVKRDLALLVDKNVNYADLKAICQKVDKKLIKSIGLFDVYEGDKLPEGKKSYAMNFTLQDETKTLTDKQIDKVMNKIQKTLAYQIGAELR